MPEHKNCSFKTQQILHYLLYVNKCEIATAIARVERTLSGMWLWAV